MKRDRAELCQLVGIAHDEDVGDLAVFVVGEGNDGDRRAALLQRKGAAAVDIGNMPAEVGPEAVQALGDEAEDLVLSEQNLAGCWDLAAAVGAEANVIRQKRRKLRRRAAGDRCLEGAKSCSCRSVDVRCRTLACSTLARARDTNLRQASCSISSVSEISR